MRKESPTLNLSTLVNTTYVPNDVTILLQDVKGRVPILDTKDREKLNQSGVHYSEMLPLEYVPSDEYMHIYRDSLNTLSQDTANAVAILAKKLHQKHGNNLVLVSIARAGTPIGILIKWYFQYFFRTDIPHYSISIIRGKGIDKCAINYIVDKHGAEHIQFLDGWVGKGAINTVLQKACQKLKQSDNKFKHLSSELAVLSDPASVTQLYGTRQDFLIPSACLNATVSGLISRTVKLPTMTDQELHGAVFYEEQIHNDLSYDFLDTVANYFNKKTHTSFNPSPAESDESFKGIEEVKQIAHTYGISDINKIKPGVGETTRVLLRRVPYKVLIKQDANLKYLQHIIRLCEEKHVAIEYYPFKKYNACGIIKDVADL